MITIKKLQMLRKLKMKRMELMIHLLKPPLTKMLRLLKEIMRHQLETLQVRTLQRTEMLQKLKLYHHHKTQRTPIKLRPKTWELAWMSQLPKEQMKLLGTKLMMQPELNKIKKP